MKRLLFAFLLCGVFESCFCQDVKGFVMKQYEEWFSSKDSIFRKSGYSSYKIKDITLGKSKTEFFNSIKSVDAVLDIPTLAIVHITFDSASLFVGVIFEPKNRHYDSDDCCRNIIDESCRHLNETNNQQEWNYEIYDIFDSNGRILDVSKSYLFLCNLATVHDKDGYVNVRAKRTKDSEVVTTIKEGDLIYYTPSDVSDWWWVGLDYGNNFMGYVHKSKIQTYEYCSPQVKKKMELLNEMY